MAYLSLATVLGIKVESASGTFSAPSTSTDLITVADLRPTIEGLTADIREYTGTIHRPGPIVLGKTFQATGRLLLRGPGGSNPPSADGWVPGRLLRAAGFTEVVTSSAAPASPEAVGGGGSGLNVILGASASATDDFYTGLMLELTALSAQSGRYDLAQVRNYVGSSKTATLGEDPASDITSGNWQLIKQLSYLLSSGTPPTLSVSCWIGGRRVDARGCAISSFRLNIPTSSRDSQDVPSIEFTLVGDIEDIADDTAPTPPTGLAVPPFRDGKMWVADKELGGSGFTIDFGAQVGYAPNPNQPTGNENAQLTETTRTLDITLNQVALTVLDDVALSDAQSYHALQALWGLAPGNAFGLMVTDFRFNHRSPDNSGAFVTSTGQCFIDGADKTIALTIPYSSSF